MNITFLNALVGTVVTGGGAAFVWALARAFGLIRSGAVRTEARAIQNLEQWRDEADERAARIGHRLDYQVTLTEYHRSNYADLAHHVRLTWGAENLPPIGPPPQYVPLPQLPRGKRDKQVTEGE